MRVTSARTILVAFAALLAVSFSSAARADTGTGTGSYQPERRSI